MEQQVLLLLANFMGYLKKLKLLELVIVAMK